MEGEGDLLLSLCGFLTDLGQAPKPQHPWVLATGWHAGNIASASLQPAAAIVICTFLRRLPIGHGKCCHAALPRGCLNISTIAKLRNRRPRPTTHLHQPKQSLPRPLNRAYGNFAFIVTTISLANKACQDVAMYPYTDTPYVFYLSTLCAPGVQATKQQPTRRPCSGTSPKVPTPVSPVSQWTDMLIQ